MSSLHEINFSEVEKRVDSFISFLENQIIEILRTNPSLLREISQISELNTCTSFCKDCSLSSLYPLQCPLEVIGSRSIREGARKIIRQLI